MADAAIANDVMGCQKEIATKVVVKVESLRIDKKTGDMTEGTRYFITSLTDKAKMAKAIRNYWGNLKHEDEELISLPIFQCYFKTVV